MAAHLFSERVGVVRQPRVLLPSPLEGEGLSRGAFASQL
jgi:hypothetical protein